MRQWLRRAWFLLRHRQLEADLAEEGALHRARKERELEARGLAPVDAHVAAQRALGNDLLAHNRSRDVWVPPWLPDLAYDLRFAARVATKERGFTAVAVFTLALGIATASTVFTIVNAMVLRGLPVENADRIITFNDVSEVASGVSFRDVEDWRAARGFEGLAAYSTSTATIGEENQSLDVVSSAYISANAFHLLRERPQLGRDFMADGDRRGAPAVVIIGHRVWTERYGSDPGIIGRTIRVNTVPATS